MTEQIFTDNYGCRNSGMPLGGMGAGSFEIRPDGHFHAWHLMNNRPWGAGAATDAMEAYGLRFGLCADFGDGARCLALEKNLGQDPGLDGWFWFSDPYHLPWVEHAEEIDYQANLPFAKLDYHFAEMPLKISLEAWSPFIPGDAAASNTPGATLTFTLTNPTENNCRVTLFGLLKNVVGYDHTEFPSRMTVLEGATPGLVCTRARLEASASSQGELGLFAVSDAPHASCYALHPHSGRDLWDPLRATGTLENVDFALEDGLTGQLGAMSNAGPTGMPRGAYGMGIYLEPGETTQLTFLLTWFFPNFSELDYRGKPGQMIGVQYANRFTGAAAVADFLLKEKAQLEGSTRAFAAAFYASSLPEWELQAVMSGLSSLWRSAWWDKAGRFGIWEGLGIGGLQTVDVAHYSSLAILQFFPELEAAQNRLTAANLEPSGKVPHTMPGNFNCCDTYDGRGHIELGAQYLLAQWRYTRWTGDLKEAEKLWPVLQNNIAWLEATDNDGDGLPNNLGPDQTYDRLPLYGTSAYVGFLYLGCLRAAAELAGWLGQSVKVIEYRQKADRASATLQEQLWNGEYYNLSYDVVSDSTNNGCMTDQLNGDWYYRQSCGEGLFPDHRVRSALLAMVKHNRRRAGHHSWLPNCTWPHGGGIEVTRRGSDQANCPWSGVEYTVAAHLALLGERKIGREVAHAVFARYEDAGMRYNHVENGHYYLRAMSSWALYQAEFGICYDARAQELSLRPPAGDANFVITLPGSVARGRLIGKEFSLQVISGKLNLRILNLRGKQIAEDVRLNVGGEQVVDI